MKKEGNWPELSSIIGQQDNLIALLDSGSSLTFIKKSICDNNSISIENLDEKISIQTASNENFAPIGKCLTDLKLLSCPNQTFKTKAILTQSLAYDMILGRDFSEQNEVIPNFRDGIIVINFQEIKMKKDLELDKLDREVQNYLTSNVCTVNDNGNLN